jgi:phospholipid/cholesterol/gamma-HCH transport system ATP-binding protein
MSNPVLEVRNLVKRYGDHTVLDGVSFEVHKGEILGIMGGSGGGKSTILKLIIGLIDPDEGSVLYEGRDLTLLSEPELNRIRPKIGFVFQNGALFDSMTVEENLRYPLIRHSTLSEDQIIDRVNSRLSAMGLEGTNSLYPSELSGGMLKRASLIRATILEPQLVLMDEPTAGLDPLKVASFVKMVRRIKKERSISGIFVSHDARAIEALCDRVIILWNGKVRFTCSPKEIQESTDPVVRSFTRPDYEVEYDETA